MPPKATSSKRGGKSRKNTINPPTPVKVDVNSASGLDPEAEDRFELELCWCIQQLETDLTSSKLQEKQAQELSKHLHSLKSNSAPLIKKRQIMRNTLGDYRAKMAEDERRLNKVVSTVRFTNSTAANKKSIFIKKAVSRDAQKLEEETVEHKPVQDASSDTKRPISINRTKTPFQFNFQV